MGEENKKEESWVFHSSKKYTSFCINSGIIKFLYVYVKGKEEIKKLREENRRERNEKEKTLFKYITIQYDTMYDSLK